MRKTRFALFQSMIALLLCFSMLVGTTFAWFTDGVSSGTNTIAAGVLDVEMEYLDAAGTWQKVTEATEVLDKNALWEPGYTEVAYLKVSNLGNLALKYGLGVQINGERGSINAAGESFLLSDHIRFGVIASETQQTYADRMQARNALTDVKFIKEGTGSSGVLYPQNSGENQPSETYITMVVFMPEEVGNAANYATGQQPPEIQLGIQLVATQAEYEADAFGTDYDAAADIPGFNFPENTFGGSVSADVKNENNQVAENVTIQGSNTNAVIPAGVQLEDGAEKLTLEVSTLDNSEANISLGENEERRSLNVHVEGVAADNAVPMEITLREAAAKGLNAGNLKVYHVENGTTVEMTQVGEFTAHNQFKYDPATGDIILYMATFSEVAMVSDTVNAWNGTVAEKFAGGDGTKENPYIIANADQLVYLGYQVSNDNANYGSKYYKLIADINIGGIENYNTNGRKVLWYPIGYNKVGGTTTDKGNWYTYGGAFSGTFDGAGHTITGIYQNTWAMVGDYSGTYYNDAMGLFGHVNGGTVKNLTIDKFYSEGEFAPTGCVTAYAGGNATFENIAITNSHPQTYNTGVAGIVGWDNGGDTEADASNFTFRNITVDSSNTISALWGSWDVAAAGLLGYLGEYSKANLQNCNVSATIDVYNDVCGNYQYYWYRYCGMLIGTVDKRLDNGNGALDLSNITAENCTVDFGDRHEYYYCEFIDNSIASYTHDYQFSRVSHDDLDFTKNPVVCTHAHSDKTEVIDGETVPVEDKRAVYIPFYQIFGGYGWGVKGTELGENLAENIKDITKKDEPSEKDQVKFKSKFTGDFLYRVGTLNDITVGTLFSAINEADVNGSGVYVSITAQHDDSISMGSFTADTSNWKNGKIRFEKTGIVKVTIQDYDYCTPTVLYLEVVDAKNVYSANIGKDANATANNVVLLENVSSGGFSVSGDNTFYGNDFTVTCAGDGSYSSKLLTQGYVNVSGGGTLENVRIVCDIYPKSYLFTMEMEESNGKYPYARSAVVIEGDSTIANCYVEGARTNIYVKTGNVVIRDTVTKYGSLANIHIDKSSDLYTVTLHNLTTIQEETSSKYDTSAKVLGMGVIVGDNESASNPTIKLSGYLKQYNWVSDDNTDVSNTYAKTALESALQNTKYQHQKNDKTYVNLGIVWLNDKTVNITDARNTGEPEYMKDTITIRVQGINATGQVYSVAAGQGSVEQGGSYQPGTNLSYEPQFKLNNTTLGSQYIANTEGCDEYCYVDGKTVKVMFESGTQKELDLANMITIEKYSGKPLEKTISVKDEGGNPVTVSDGKLVLSVKGDYIVTYSVIDKELYDKNGNKIEGEIPYSWDVVVSVSLKDKATPNAEITFDTNKQKVYNDETKLIGTGDYVQMVQFLDGLRIHDYKGQEKYLRFNGDTDFNKIAKVSIGDAWQSGSYYYQTITLELVDGGVLYIDIKESSGQGGSSTHNGSIFVGDLDGDGIKNLVFANNGKTGQVGQTWIMPRYEFKGNNGVSVKESLNPFGSTENYVDDISKPSTKFGTTISATVTFDANGGNSAQAVAYATSVATSVTLPSPTRSGYIFAGWYTAASGGTRVGGAGESYTPAANITLYAQWGQPCTVTYNANGGSCGTTSEKYTGTALTLPTPTRDGYWFIGWYDAAEGGNKIGDAGAKYNPAGEITLYAHWQEQIEYTVTYNANGGTCGTVSATYEGAALTLPTPTKPGSEFLGWYTALSGGTKIGNAGETYTPDANVTLYAQWEQISYTITISKQNNATVTVDKTTAHYNDTISVTVSFSQNNSKTLTVKDASGNTVLSKSAAGTYTFTMPASNVTIEASSSGSCVTADTLVTLADGTQKRIDQVTYADQLLVWDFDKSAYTVANSSIIENHGYSMNEIIKLNFEDGTTVKVANVHGFFDADLNKWVDINAKNAADYVGHSFVQVDGNSHKTVKLVSVDVTAEYVEAWSILTADHYNCILEDMFTITPPATEQLAFFEIGEDMKYDAEAKQADIEKYGLYTYEEFANLLTVEQFEVLNIAEMKVAVGKGLITMDEILWLIVTYIPN